MLIVWTLAATVFPDAADDALVDALSAFGESDVRRVLVLEGRRLVGLLLITDVARALEIPHGRLERVQHAGQYSRSGTSRVRPQKKGPLLAGPC